MTACIAGESGSTQDIIAIGSRCRKTFFYQRRLSSVFHGISHCFQGLQARATRSDWRVSADIFSMTPVRGRVLLPGAAGLRPRSGLSE